MQEDDAAQRAEVAELLALWMSEPSVPVYAMVDHLGRGPSIVYRGVLYGLIGGLVYTLLCEDEKAPVAGLTLHLEHAWKLEVWSGQKVYVKNGQRVEGKLVKAQFKYADQLSHSITLYFGFNPYDHRNASMYGDDPLFT